MSAGAARLAAQLRGLASERVDKCRVVRISDTVQLCERQSDDGRRLVIRGIHTCGSVHSCPTCAERILSERGEELQDALGRHGVERSRLVTFTLRHHAGMNLYALQRVLAVAYGELKAGRTGHRLKGELGYVGDVKGAEQTWGENGWHPHLHAVWFFEGAPPEQAEQLLTERWLTCVENTWNRFARLLLRCTIGDESARPSALRLFGRRYMRDDLRETAALFERDFRTLGSDEYDVMPAASVAVRVTECSNAAYLSKMGLEVTGILKQAHEGHYTSWQIAQLAAQGDEQARELWSEHARAMRGQRRITWSRGIRERLCMREERNDADIVQDNVEPGESERLLATVGAADWDANARLLRQGFAALLIEGYELGRLREIPGVHLMPSPWLPIEQPLDERPLWWESMRLGRPNPRLRPLNRWQQWWIDLTCGTRWV